MIVCATYQMRGLKRLYLLASGGEILVLSRLPQM